MKQKLADIEREVILSRLKAMGWNRRRAAKSLGIGVRTLGLKIQNYRAAGIVVPTSANDPANRSGPKFNDDGTINQRECPTCKTDEHVYLVQCGTKHRCAKCLGEFARRT